MLAVVEAQSGASAPPAEEAYASLGRLRKQFSDYRTLKAAEVDEQREARLYYHGSQWTKAQIEELKKRKQPVVTTPNFARKINGFVGLVERLRQDPKAYPRTPKEDAGAELSTAALRYALDQQQWDAKSPVVSLNGAVDAIGGIEIGLEEGDSGAPGDHDVSIEAVEPDTFFYDPRSFKHDFSDARFMGVSKWLDLDDAKDKFPDQADQLDAFADSYGSEFAIDSDRETKWFNSEQKQVLIVEHWYRRGNKWLWCFFTGTLMLDQGRSPFRDEKGRDECRFIMWRSFVDQDGDSYSFHRYMKSLVDEINQRRSKALHLLAMRRIKMTKGAVDDVELLRREAVRPDGVIEYNTGFELDFEDAKNLADMRGQVEMLQQAEAALENFGPNPALVGQGVEAKSGKAIQLLQQAGIAELGPFIIAYRGWKIRVYRAIWNAIRTYWTAERWIRVTDQEGNEQQVAINARTDPETGQFTIDGATGEPIIFNQLGALDVDIIIDEGPDSITMMADALETLQGAMANGTAVPAEAIYELLPIPDSLKKKLIGFSQQAQQPNPVQQQQIMLQLQEMAAKVREIESRTLLNEAKARETLTPEQPSAPDAGPTDAETIDTLASAEQKRSAAILNIAKAEETRVKTALAPQEMAQRAAADRARAQQMSQRTAARQ
jgi:hypothetical protein